VNPLSRTFAALQSLLLGAIFSITIRCRPHRRSTPPFHAAE
jgi:hypothetical protein